MEELSMVIPNDAQYIGVARLAVGGLASKMNFNTEDVEDIKVCLSEACNTVIQSKKLGGKIINIYFRVEPDGLVIKVGAEGNALDERIWEKYHEIGKTFVETLMDDVKYIKQKKKGTSVEMTKYINEIDDNYLRYKH
ncbi:MAG: ATP-binding protein [Candidatus Margulisbacteria bacterium]|nr:ATP-binding protein [Candidatus Margulisiibacteriota bacterium]